MYADRTNRALLTLLGTSLLAAGTAGVLAGTEVFGSHLAGRYLTDNPIARYVGDNSIWFWPVIALAGVIAAGLALRWLIAVLTPPARAGDIVIAGDRADGPTTLNAGTLADAVTTEIDSYRGIDASHAGVYGSPTDPRLAITVRTSSDADIAAVRHHIEDDALTHVRHVLNRPDLPVILDIAVGKRHTSRVS
ncbi:hypothetical protein ADL15_05130 [Actinoplanes awajinensis subsp. mycoplanecinus]|uniref:Alkaline shock response membrane anchor protein AmaP n=2 Tax=Actinoplanes awajinensis TaxID=135946 RepID=A0A0X3V8X1_9ACTN|nr:hypothetical protein ADL15_05130 [Actinoplanes awajinensis subsp. mycoplanecinus]